MKRILCAAIAVLLLLVPLQPASGVSYYGLGDYVEDFTVVDSDGNTLTLSGLLQDHKAVLLSFWFAGCGPCRYNFPYLENAYQSFKDEVAVLALTPYDDSATIARFKDFMGLSFYMAYDEAGITDRFVSYGFPTNVMIDRNGVVCYIECGAQDGADAFVRLLSVYTGTDYSGPLLLSAIPSFSLPEAPAAEQLSAALNTEGGRLRFYCPKGSWPWMLSEDGSYVISANSGSNSSAASLETEVNAQAGDALSFRFCTSSEEGYDMLNVLVDGRVSKIFSGENAWRSYAIPLEKGKHTISFVYSKNEVDSAGADEAALDDVALLSGQMASAALAQNPVYPQALPGGQMELVFQSDNLRKIAFDDPQGALAAYYGADEYYILPDAETLLFVRLGKACDPDAAFLRDIDGNALSLSHCVYDEEGFYYALAPVNQELGWNALFVYPSILDSFSQPSVYLYFDSEEAVDAFCREQIYDPMTGDLVTDVTWDYAEEQ